MFMIVSGACQQTCTRARRRTPQVGSYSPGFMTPVSTRPTGTVPRPRSCRRPAEEYAEAFQQAGQAPGLVNRIKERLTLVPWHVLRPLNHVVAIEARDGDKLNLVRVEARALQGVVDRSLDLVVPLLGVGDRLLVHLVYCNNHLIDSKRVRQKMCSRVRPFFETPASNSPDADATTTTVTSACDVTVITFLMKSRWPGVSMTVKLHLLVSNFHSRMPIVIPRSR